MRLEFEQAAANYQLHESAESSALPKSSESAADIIKRGIVAARAGNRTQARILLKHGVELEPDSEVAWMWLASISEYPEELLVFLDHALLINPENLRAAEWKDATEALLAKTFVKRGIDAAEAGAKESSVRYFKEALKYDEQDQVAWSWLALLQDKGNEALPDVVQDASTPMIEVTAPVFVEEQPLPMEPPKHYVAPHSESVVLHPLPTFASNDDGPTQELVFPDSLLESNPFDSIAEETGTPPPAMSLESFGYVSHEVTSYQESIAGYSADPGDGPADIPLESTVHDCDIQEVLEAMSLENFEEGPVHTVQEDVTQQQRSFAPARENLENLSTNNDEGICPFCKNELADPHIICGSCDAMLTLSDMDALLSHMPADPSSVEGAVHLLQQNRDDGNLDSGSLTNLAVGYLNLGNLESAFSCLREASAADPNNVLISNNLNTLAIRIEEIEHRQGRTQEVPTGKKILVVDDSPTIRKLISSKLEKSGHEVFCAVDGVDAVEMLKQLRPDLVLLDISMPRMDGYEVCKTIRSNEKTSSIPVVMISGKDGFFDKVRGKMAGSTDYIAKPFGPEALMQALGKYLTSESDESQIEE